MRLLPSSAAVPLLLFAAWLSASPRLLTAQVATVKQVEKYALPTHIDGNSSLFWAGGQLHMFSSTGDPVKLSTGDTQFTLGNSVTVDTSKLAHMPAWIEAAWRDEDGTIYGWYHHEPGGICPDSNLTTPKIGAVVSHDGGRTLEDLGIILESGFPANCSSPNGFFAGGHGDFSVVLDRQKNFFYFLFTNYGGPDWHQGVGLARLPFEHRAAPVGRVQKYFFGSWDEPGLGGNLSAVYPAFRNWQSENTDSYWGPSIHWNTHLEKYVVLMNRSCCEPGWPQEGVYVSFFSNFDDPSSWAMPAKLMDGQLIGHRPGYYPQVIGLEKPEKPSETEIPATADSPASLSLTPGGTDTLAGQTARLYIHGISNWEISFAKEGQMDPELPPPPPLPSMPSVPEPQASRPLSRRP